jgi:hypothetical protein
MSSFPDLAPLLDPRAIAVVGASERPGSAGRLVLENLRHLTYPGTVYAVHPRYQQVLGFPCYPDPATLPSPVDSVAVLLGADKVLPTLGYRQQTVHCRKWKVGACWPPTASPGRERSWPPRRTRADALVEPTKKADSPRDPCQGRVEIKRVECSWSSRRSEPLQMNHRERQVVEWLASYCQ